MTSRWRHVKASVVDATVAAVTSAAARARDRPAPRARSSPRRSSRRRPTCPGSTDADGGQALAEFAGRACYQSWNKPNPATATNAGYLRHILEVGHLSVLEHGTVTMYLTGVSRSLTHELIRHRHFSYSQLSQRYVPERDAAFVEPAVIAEDPELHETLPRRRRRRARRLRRLLEGLEKRFADVPNATLRRKQARQAARAVLPNATETRIVVTGNYRAWRHFIAMRASEHADVEIRELAVACLRELQRVAPNVFDDFRISALADGTEVAASPRSPRAEPPGASGSRAPDPRVRASAGRRSARWTDGPSVPSGRRWTASISSPRQPIDTQYEDLLRRVLEHGHAQGATAPARARVSVFGHQLRYDLRRGLPAGHDEEGALPLDRRTSCCGSCAATATSAGCRSNGVTIWDEWADAGRRARPGLRRAVALAGRRPDGGHIDQIAERARQLRTRPRLPPA